MADKNRPLHILKYLWDHTDEEHPAIITDILAHLKGCGIHTNRKTVASDLADLQDSGFDVVCNKSRQNQYFIGSRSLELAELKMIVDAIQAAKFISESKSLTLIEKVSSLASPHQAEQLKRRLYVEGKAKTTNETVNYTVDLLQSAIQSQKAIEFQYIEYTPRKEKVLKYDGYTYRFSPYDLVWNNDSYYVFGWIEKYKKVIKFRVDRMHHPKFSEVEYHPRPDNYDIQVGISLVYLSNLENDRMPAPKDDVVSSIARQLHLNEADTAMLYDLAAKAKNSTVVSQDLPDYIIERDIVRTALRTVKDVDATDEEWQEFIASLEACRRKKQEGE